MAITEQDLELPAEPASVRDARRFVREVLGGLGAAPSTEVALLLTSELVTNAILHAGGPVVVHVTARDGWVRVGVRDRSTARPRHRPSPASSLTGRGLGLVERLSEHWGIDLCDSAAGKEVWFELRA